MVTDRDGNIYEGAAGVRRMGTDDAITTDDVFAIFSTTKAITATAALQLVEAGQLDLDAPAPDYAPRIGELQVLEGFDDAGNPVQRAPRSVPTTRQLLTHTGGFGYDFFDVNYCRLAEEHGQPSVITSTMAALTTPLLFDPGERWQYGTNLDWVGQVVEGITGARLGEVFAEKIFAPLGIENVSFDLRDDFRPRLAQIHARAVTTARSPRWTWNCRRRPRCTWAGTGCTWHRRRLHEVHPHVAQRRCRRTRPGAQRGAPSRWRCATTSATCR